MPKLLRACVSVRNLMAQKGKRPLICCKNLLLPWFSLLLLFTPVAPTIAAQELPTSINIVVVQGEGAIDNVRQRVARDPAIRVEDENHRPVAGAVVVFNLPVSGTSGEFGNGGKTLTVATDQNGLAEARGLTTNQVPGRLQILLTASYRGLTARGLINQTVQGTPGATGRGASHKLVLILAVAAAAAAGGAVAATRGGGARSSPGVPTPVAIGISPGTGTITQPPQ